MLKYEEAVRKIISHNTKQEESNDLLLIDTNLENVGMNSIGFVKLVVEIEYEFNIEFPDEKLLFTQANTIEKICHIIEMCK